ncbi:hypothetical protein HR45_08335 [Shewanella mangrovi]|uniref:Secreted protein n=1 Tax=Shewanella mangrovi TaxID=1515746 RepID=A0A094JDA2_9GAMM|nr:hypothetical protein [Shewanella mangrovi]KFZ37850.1 hypothetical protein HR45_08335 [Shewanella mangrovi]
MRHYVKTWLLCLALITLVVSPAYAGHRGGYYHPSHHHYRHHHNDWGWYLGLSTLVLLPEIIRQTQPRMPEPYPYYAPYAPAVTVTPLSPYAQDYDASYGNDDALPQNDSAYAKSDAATDLESGADMVTTSRNAARSYERPTLQSGVRSLPANARVIQTAHGTEYEWLGQRYHYDWQTELYMPLSR